MTGDDDDGGGGGDDCDDDIERCSSRFLQSSPTALQTVCVVPLQVVDIEYVNHAKCIDAWCEGTAQVMILMTVKIA